jgi:hypothetical protein
MWPTKIRVRRAETLAIALNARTCAAVHIGGDTPLDVFAGLLAFSTTDAQVVNLLLMSEGPGKQGMIDPS